MSETAGICRNCGCLRSEHRSTDLRCPDARSVSGNLPDSWLESSFDSDLGLEALGVVKLVVRQQEDALAFATKLIDGLHPLHCSDPGCLSCANHRKEAIGLILTRDARVRMEAVVLPEDGYRVVRDGDGWCAVGPGPKALRSTPFFGGTPIEALHGLLVREEVDRYRAARRGLAIEE